MSVTYYVDSTNGSDSFAGNSPEAAFRSLAKVQSVLQPGDVVCLHRGSEWHEAFYVTKSNVTIRGYGEGDNPLVHGDNANRAGILIAGSDCVVEHIDVTSTAAGIYITGIGASGTVIGGTFSQNGTGICVGGGGRLILADGVTCIDNVRANGAGDGIQVSQDASAGTHTIVNANLSGNENSGLNGKAGTVVVSNSTLCYNGEPGWIAQNDIDVFRISNSLIKGNNLSDNGVGQASLEDHATVYSTGNRYENPENGNLATVQINVISYNGKLYSVDDTFINDADQTNTIGSIRVNTGAAPTLVSVLRGRFEHASGSGIAIDGYGASGLQLSVEDSVFLANNTRAVRLDPGAIGAARLDYNQYYRADSGTLIDVEGRFGFAASELGELQSLLGFEQHGIALSGWTDRGNHAPVSMQLSRSHVTEDVNGAVVGNLAIADPDGDTAFTFSVSDSRFEICSDTGTYKLSLKSNASLDYEAEPEVAVTVTVTDAGGLSAAQTFDVAVVNAGEAASTPDKVLVLRPLASTNPGETHAALVVSQADFEGRYFFNARVQTTEQLRQNSEANPWETAWLVWGYQDNAHFYYFTLKTNGWELGKVDPAYPGGQRFLATGSSHPLEIGAWHDVGISVNGTSFTIFVDGQVVTTFTDTQGPLYARGKVGFYTEDAEIRVDEVTAPIVQDFGSLPSGVLHDGQTLGPWQVVFDGYGTVEIEESAAPRTLLGTMSDDELHGTSFIDLIEGYAGNDYLSGAGGTDSLNGGAGADTIHGGDGNDSLIGGIGGDLIAGGPGDDTYTVEDIDNLVEYVGQGSDRVVALIDWTLGDNFELLDLASAAALGVGNAVANEINGNANNNWLDGKGGADIMRGGEGNDTYIFETLGDYAHEAWDDGLDTVLLVSGFDYTLTANIERLWLGGAGDFQANGNELGNEIIGNDGNNILNGGLGADTLYGGRGNDLYIIDNAGDVVSEAAKQGTDTVNSLIDYTLNVNVENLNIIGAGNINAYGSNIDNVVNGNGGNNTLTGEAGNDTLNGGVGMDNLVGGSGNDTLTGGNDGDRLEGGTGDDTLNGGAGDDLFVFGPDSGHDMIQDFTPGAGSDDRIDLRQYGFADFNVLLAATSDIGGSAVITLSVANDVTISGILKAQLHEQDFIF